MDSEKDWYYQVTSDWNKLPDFVDYFSSQAEEARKELSMRGKLEDHAKDIPVIVERRFSQLQIINALIRYFEIKLDSTKSALFKKYIENYDRQLSSRDVEKYVDGEKDVTDLNLLINEICMVRNIFVGITKGIENKSFQINNITKLRASGLDDARIE
jgi:hypothetical protein